MAVSKPKTGQNLNTVFTQWDKEKLVQYAISITGKLQAAQRDNEALSEQFASAQNSLQGLTLVEEIGQHLSSTLDLDEVLTQLMKRINETLDASDGSILLVEEPSGDLVFQISLGSVSEQIKPFRVPRGEGIAGEVAATGQPIRVDNAQKDSRHFNKIDHNTGYLTESILCVPLIAREKIIGVVEVFNKRNGSFDQADQVFLCSIANYAAIAIENARLHQSALAEKDRVVQAQEEVSRQLQRDLHDGPTQLVANIQMSVDFCKKALSRDVSMVESELDNITTLAEKANHQMRTLLFELRPLVLESQGLVAALESFLDRRQKDESTRLHLEVDTDLPDGDVSRLESRAESALFAVVQEAVINALKHAKADNIFVRIRQRGQRLWITILDDGLGFDLNLLSENYEERGSYGMVNIRERAELAKGTLQVKSAPGAGTSIIVEVPVPEGISAE